MKKRREEDAHDYGLSKCPRGMLATGADEVLDEVQRGAYELKAKCTERVYSLKRLSCKICHDDA